MNVDFLVDTIDHAGADLLFAVILVIFYGVLILALLFAGALFRAAWRWLMRNTWNDLIVFVERRALGKGVN
jgi:succinate dehydrogenase hydrophobic anchor subunit